MVRAEEEQSFWCEMNLTTEVRNGCTVKHMKSVWWNVFPVDAMVKGGNTA